MRNLDASCNLLFTLFVPVFVCCACCIPFYFYVKQEEMDFAEYALSLRQCVVSLVCVIFAKRWNPTNILPCPATRRAILPI